MTALVPTPLLHYCGGVLQVTQEDGHAAVVRCQRCHAEWVPSEAPQAEVERSMGIHDPTGTAGGRKSLKDTDLRGSCPTPCGKGTGGRCAPLASGAGKGLP